MPDEAVLDAPTTDSGAIDTGSVDTSTDTSTSTEASQSVDAIDNADTPQSGETGHLRGADLYRAVKEKLKAAGLSPAEQRSLRNAIHIAAKADQMSGGDLNSFETQRQAYAQLAFEGEESLTPEDLVATVRGDREQLQSILNDIQSGAPKLLDEMIQDHPESFKTLVPQAMDKLAELDNERFSNYVAKSAVNYLVSQGIQVEFAVMNEFMGSMPDFPGKNRLIQAMQSVYKAVNGLETLASKQVASPALQQGANGTQNGTQGGDLEAREANVVRMEWNQTAGAPNIKLRDTEMTRVAGTRKVTLTDAEKNEIKANVREEFETRLAANRQYGQAMQGYLKNRNQRAYNERAASEGQKLLPSIVSRHTNAVIDKRTAAAAAQKTSTNGQQRTQTTTTQAKDGQGNLIQWLGGPPKMVGKQVDYMKTSNAMLLRGEAYLKGEKGLFKWKSKTVAGN